MNRRQFVATSAAFVATVNQADAHSTKTHDGWVKTPNLPPEFLPKVVDLPGGFAPGEIHVDPSQFALFWTLPEGRALRYIVGIGRKGLYEAGEFYVAAKREWPRWTPTPSMIKRNPKNYKKFAKGVPGGLKNPLGARALYLYQPGRGDTYLRIHGTPNPDTIGQRVSNGCARLSNDQIIDFYEKVPLQTRVVLNPIVT